MIDLWIHKYLSFIKFRGVTESYLRDTQRRLNTVTSLVSDITVTQQWLDAITKLTEGHTQRSKGAYLGACKQFTKYLFNVEELARDPLALIKNISSPEAERRPHGVLTPDAVEALCRQGKYRILWATLSSTGVRPGELKKLRVKHRVGPNVIRIPAEISKLRRTQEIYADQDLLDTLCAGRDADTELIYVPANLSKVLRKDLERVGQATADSDGNAITAYSLRHYAVTYFVNNAPLNAAISLARLRSPKQIRRYTLPTQKQLIDTLKTFAPVSEMLTEATNTPLLNQAG